jgi:Domain of unknown function (DUF4214)
MTKSNSRRVNIPGIASSSTATDFFTAALKRWRHKLGYCSIVAAVPAILASDITEARFGPSEKPEVNIAGEKLRTVDRNPKSCSNPTLLKRQSEFLLPHQKGNFAMLAPALAGNDDCPGRTIPGGNYSAAAPYVDFGDTTGANNTITRAQYYAYCYYSDDVPGPDHVYSFTLTARGANPQILVSRTSGSYQPYVYVLDSRTYDGRYLGCPSATGITTCGMIVSSGSGSNGIATLDSNQMKELPLNVPLHLFVDSSRTDATGSGPYKVEMTDVTVAPTASCLSPNPIDCTDFFVRQHYRDFLGREPDPQGYAGWQNILNGCKDGVQTCDRIEVSAAFFRSPEFQGRGYYIYRFYSALGRIPLYEEFTPDFAKVSGFLTDDQLDAAKAAFVDEVMARAEFQNRYGTTFSNPPAYVDALLLAVGLPNHQYRQLWIDSLTSNNTAQTRSQVLRQLVESTEVYSKYYNEAFVIMQYFGFLRRTADGAYVQWVQTMKDTGGNYRIMINGFVNSVEYRKRFGP